MHEDEGTANVVVGTDGAARVRSSSGNGDHFSQSARNGPATDTPACSLAVTLLVQDRGVEALTQALREPEEWERLCALAIIHSAKADAWSPTLLWTR